MPKKKRFRSRFQGDDQGGSGGAASRPRVKKSRRRYGSNYQQAFAEPEGEPGEVALDENGDPIPTEAGEPATEEPGQEFLGLLEMHPNGYGFLRSPSNNYSRERTDPFVPGTMIEKFKLRQGVKIIPVISYGAHDTLFVLGDCYEQAQKFHGWGMPWLLDIDPEVFPIYLGLPWGLALGPLPNFPLPSAIHTEICQPITFERYGKAAVRDRDYVEACYLEVETKMQQALDRLVAEKSGTSLFSLPWVS